MFSVTTPISNTARSGAAPMVASALTRTVAGDSLESEESAEAAAASPRDEKTRTKATPHARLIAASRILAALARHGRKHTRKRHRELRRPPKTRSENDQPRYRDRPILRP